MPVVALWWKYYLVVCYQTSLFNPPFSDVLASMNSSMVGVFVPHELTNTTNQGSTYCFVGCLEQMTANYSPWAKSSPLTVLYSLLWAHRLALWTAETKLGIPHCVPSAPSTCLPGWWPHIVTAQDPSWFPRTHWKLYHWQLLNTEL